jgi:hypothetical protein
LETTITAVLEDGLLEEEIQLGWAIFAKTIWNPERKAKDYV